LPVCDDDDDGDDDDDDDIGNGGKNIVQVVVSNTSDAISMWTVSGGHLLRIFWPMTLMMMMIVTDVIPMDTHDPDIGH
jgi:hypothetical protein